MSDFHYFISETVHYLAVGEGNVKNRLSIAATKYLIFANIPENENTPVYFRNKHKEIMSELTKKTWSPDIKDDRIRATLHRSHFKTVCKIAEKIWGLFEELEEYKRSGFIPENS